MLHYFFTTFYSPEPGCRGGGDAKLPFPIFSDAVKVEICPNHPSGACIHKQEGQQFEFCDGEMWQSLERVERKDCLNEERHAASTRWNGLRL